METVSDFIFGGSKITVDDAAMNLKDAYSLESYVQPKQHIKKQRYYFANKCLSSQGYCFSSGQALEKTLMLGGIGGRRRRG